MENVHVGSHENCHEGLDSSQGFRVCNRCDYNAEDRYELDGHLWYGHEEDEDGHVFCKFCDERFANIPNMMMHKNYETYNRSARVLFSSKSLSSNLR